MVKQGIIIFREKIHLTSYNVEAAVWVLTSTYDVM